METLGHGAASTTPGDDKGNWWNAIGVGVVCCFAAIWAWMGAGALHYGTMAIRIAAIVLSAILLAARAATINKDRNGPVNRKLLAATIVGEVVTLWIMGMLLERWERPDLLLPCLAVIVGVHFFPMARAVGIPAYRMTAATMSGIGVGSLALAQTPRTALLGLGCAVILWLTIGRPLWERQQ